MDLEKRMRIKKSIKKEKLFFVEMDLQQRMKNTKKLEKSNLSISFKNKFDPI